MPNSLSELRDKLDTDEVSGPEGVLDWDAIDWQTHESNVRRLRRRIFKATREQDWAQVRSLQKMTAPRGARSYPRFSREELEGRFLGLMANLGPKDVGGQQHARKPAAASRRMERRVGGPVRYWLKLDCLYHNLQKVQLHARRKDA
jgi:hypothetical protein